ncbi:FAD/NAD(P)-binding protein [Aureimonas sp. OT7]|uniref:FAD/NAD(P)-binding protein n=1 Tax=Aureimonas sp. OT7 TaxID=2816454 RepID=UPI0017846A28|nr:FAD/NAD(P)-binding protein [Aureimonas sp. OT7]QOG08259.1 FAD/NAD(P)-binding protein [Aureimonas sp. OT7]
MGGGHRGVIIVGGGFSGAAIAYHLCRMSHLAGLPIRIVEPRARLGCGLAYSATDPAHRINVPAARMSLLPDEPGHFQAWLDAGAACRDDPAAFWPATGALFPQRGLFGRYVAEQLAPFVADGRVRHLRQWAVQAGRDCDGWDVTLSDGSSAKGELLILAATHPRPGTPAQLATIAGSPSYVADPYAVGALDAIGSEARILIVGSGLTAADMVATLDGRGHRGEILCLSRNGLRSRGHCVQTGAWTTDFHDAAAQGARPLVGAIRQEISRAAQAGAPWQWVMDHIRDSGSELWTALAPAERIRLVRRLRSYWDVHRFRVAPQIEAVLDRRERAGTFRHVAARLVASTERDGRLEVRYRQRGEGQVRTGRFDAVINTTGPSHGDILSGEGLPARMAAAGLLRRDPTGLGIETDRAGRAIAADGRGQPDLLVGGPLARGTFGELMGLPEVSRYAKAVADSAADRLSPLPNSLLRSVPGV